ncbi:lectin-like [Oryza brachyantha]|uniref:Uncharacterized protein n=1 Tax=Oryza brachyantha TaxID=4533 RepID=J3KWL8_ORYBR|nr:lectin-like [Oryza brachyantha]
MGASPSQLEAPSSSSDAGNGNQAQPKKAAPHMFQEIVAGEKATTASTLEDQIYTGIFLAGKTKKYWVDGATMCNCFMLYPRGLSITWGETPTYWTWYPPKDGSNDADNQIEVASLLNVCWLEIHGKLELSYLTPGVTYEVFFKVMLTDKAYGWSVPVNLRLKLPDGTVQQRKEKLQEKIRGKWLRLKVGEVKTQQGQKGQIEISMFEYDGGHWKSGLLIKGIKILPKE